MPQPPTIALAVPTTLCENMLDVQDWDMTKEAPSRPMAERTATRCCHVEMLPTQNTGMAPRSNTADMVRLGPKRSDSGPKSTRAKMVVETEARLA